MSHPFPLRLLFSLLLACGTIRALQSPPTMIKQPPHEQLFEVFQNSDTDQAERPFVLECEAKGMSNCALTTCFLSLTTMLFVLKATPSQRTPGRRMAWTLAMLPTISASPNSLVEALSFLLSLKPWMKAFISVLPKTNSK